MPSNTSHKHFHWYHQWHETWIHGPSHWVVFACAVAIASTLVTYAIRSGSGAGIVEVANAQVTTPITLSACQHQGCTLTIPRRKMYMLPSNPNTIWALFEKSNGNLMKSTDGGLTWGTPFTVRSWLDYHAALDGDSQGNLYIADPGYGYAYFRKVKAPAASASDLMPPINLTSSYIPSNVWTRTNVIAQDSSNIFVFARTSNSTVGSVRYFRSTDGGATFPEEGWVSETGYNNVRIGSLLINGQPAVVIWYSSNSENEGWGYKYFVWNGSQFVANEDSTIVWGAKVYRREYSMVFVNGIFHTVYQDSSGHLLHSWKAYNNGTGTWTQQTVETLPYGPRDWHPSFTQHGDDLYLFYIRQESSTAGNNNVYYRTWNPVTHTWSSATAVTTDGGDNRFPTGPASVPASATFVPFIWGAPVNTVKFARVETAAAACTEAWSCSAWSSCVGGTQTRTCTDANSCGTTTSKPTESQSCTPADSTAPASVTDLIAN